uniref:Uncharacterized protein n=1 Tax=Tanacetum cinerariifolium TaxID=118510 RepID=A0A699KL56_TANCI|nr:hypothetical protein [Tanacetum cinerariifolium]
MMDHYKKKALWIYWIRGDDEVELTDDESYNNEDEVAKVFRSDTNIFDFETPMCKVFKEFNCLLQIDPNLLTKDIKGFKTYDEYKDVWIYEWNKDVPWNGQHVVGRMMDSVMEETYPELTLLETHSIIRIMNDHRQRSKINHENGIEKELEKPETLKIDDVSPTYDTSLENFHTEFSRLSRMDDDLFIEELCEIHELPVFYTRRFEMIKYLFRDDEEYIAVKEDEYDDLTKKSKDACRAYQEIFRMMDEGWMVTKAE